MSNQPSNCVRFALSGAAGMSGWMFVHPFDVIKVRMQLLGEAGGAKAGAGVALKSIMKDGPLGFYAGLSAALLRQASYTTLRLGFYDIFRDKIEETVGTQSVFTKLSAGLTAGAVASFLSCPVEVCLVRMQADGRLPLAERRGYKNVFDALKRVAKEEGLTTYWRGATPTIFRAMVVNMTQVATYDQFKHTYKALGLSDGTPLHFAAALSSGLVYSFCSLPLDLAKTRMQSQKALESGELLYKSLGDTLVKIARTEGPTALWKGYTAYFLRSGGHTVAMFLCLEQYRKLYKKLSEK
eukprot:GCRY01000528.1.p1 GENE.GCRY01000528.1~~GCRY01000528.1.p1  ORF type:complete len:296 (-),score=86.82 GCRY01000528.1:418-1305(-)